MTATATAAVAIKADENFVLKEVTLDDLRDNELLVRVEAVGVCHTDATLKHLLPLPAVLGHEGVGIVEAVGAAVTRIKVGDRVVISYPHCGSCPHCEEHKPALCDNFAHLAMSGSRPDGSATIFLEGKPITSAFFAQSSFATRAITTESNVCKVDAADQHPERFAALPCGIVTGAGAMLNTVKIHQGQSLAVFGAGAVGLSAVMAAHSQGVSPLIVVDVVPERLELAKELGATHTIDGRADDVAAQIRAITGYGADICFDTSGNIFAFNNAVAGARKGGTLALVTAPNIGSTFDFDGMAFLSQALTMIGVQMGDSITTEFIPHLLKLNQEGKFPYEKLISYYDFNNINQAFEESHSGKAIKPVLIMPKA